MAGEVFCVQEGAVAWVTLSHPGRLNAMSRTMWRALRELFHQLNQRPGLRVVAVRGAHGQFCAGGDISEYPQFRFEETQLEQFHEHEVWGALKAMLACKLPVLAVIEGNCMGAGLEIAACCDLRIATEQARFGAPIARLGFPMAPREAALIAQQLGTHLAREMLLAASVVAADRLLRVGFLNQVVAAPQLQACAQSWLDRLRALAPQAAAYNKHTLRQLNPAFSQYLRDESAPETGADALCSGTRRPYAYADSAEHREGIAAFLDKRAPVF